MSAELCGREDELVTALGRGFLDADLLAHVEDCGSCRELQLVATALLEERAAAAKEATVPGAGTMWWRMQVRHRQEARTAARRALLVGQAVTLAVAMTLLLALFGVEVARGLRHVVAVVRVGNPLLLLALAALLLAAPIGAWLAVRQR